MVQAKLFLEINTNQQGADSQLKQCIGSILNPSSPTSISRHIIEKLNQSGPLEHMFAMKLSDEHKIKTASIVSFALSILVRPGKKDGLWSLWDSDKKEELKNETCDNALLREYQDFCTTKIRDFMVAAKYNLGEKWAISAPKSEGILNVTSINGMLNCIRKLIAHDEISDDVAIYRKKLEHLSEFNFKEYKSSQYNKLGEALYKKYWGTSVKESEE